VGWDRIGTADGSGWRVPRSALSRRTLLRAGAGGLGLAAGFGGGAALAQANPPGQVALPPHITATVNVSYLNVRQGPSTTYRILGELHQGDQVTCLVTSGDWFQIASAHLAGYVYSPSVTLNSATLAKVVPRGLTTRPLVTLSMDCGADRGFAPQIIATLAAHKIRASFGMTGHWADENPDLARRIAADGHHFINHTRTHRSFTGFSTNTEPLSPAQRLAELEWTEAKLKQLIGHGAKPWFRTPYTDGDNDPGVLRDVAADGFSYDVAFTVDTLGWKGASADEIVARVQANNGNGYIYLLHVGSQSQDGPALERVIATLQQAGLGFTTIPDLFGVSEAGTPLPAATPPKSATPGKAAGG